jgi:hypothetical protein
MNLSQTVSNHIYYRNIGYFERIYKCENLTFHLQPEKDVTFVSEMVCLAIIIYRCIKQFSWYGVDQRN